MNKKHPTKLTADEWNLLQELTEYNKMDCWFWLCENSRGYDYVFDRENNVNMSLHDAIEQVCEGMYDQDVFRFKNGKRIWNGMMDRFSLPQYKVSGRK